MFNLKGGYAMNKKGQGTTEYLIILAVIIVIALIVVGVMGWIPGIGTGITESQSRAYWQSTSPFAITLYEVSESGAGSSDLVLRNQTSNTLTVTAIDIEGVQAFSGSQALVGGTEKSITVSKVPSCNSGNPYSYDVTITYTRTVGGAEVTLTQTGTKPLVGTCAP
jgi:hypothetical protein